ncbi:MAG: 7-cyano-7-deazaguanine synthase QueC [Waddliaceae bacterium]|nr:7-cyano-7-deazaguanine synthase QueC [Waddliaceae bacterium]
MDSSICLALAIKKYSADEVLSLSFRYGQRHSPELIQAKKISEEWNVDHIELSIDCLQEITDNALMNTDMVIDYTEQVPNTLVLGRNGLMARIAAIHAHSLGAKKIALGVMGLEEANSGYRDCSRRYMNLMEEILRIDLDDESFEVLTPLVDMTKAETMKLADELGVLDYLLENTITCYEGLPKEGCKVCPACKLRNEGILEYRQTQYATSL